MTGDPERAEHHNPARPVRAEHHSRRTGCPMAGHNAADVIETIVLTAAYRMPAEFPVYSHYLEKCSAGT